MIEKELSKQELKLTEPLIYKMLLERAMGYDIGKILLVELNKTQRGYVNGKENYLLANWFAMQQGILAYFNPSLKTNDGYMNAWQLLGDAVCGACNFLLGQGANAETFGDYTITSGTNLSGISKAVGYLSDRSRISVYGSAPSNGYELGINFNIYTANGCFGALGSRRVMSVTAGDYLEWDFDFLNPWLLNWARIMFGIFAEADISGLVDTGSRTFTGRFASAQLPALASYLVVSNNTTPWSPTQNKLIGTVTGLTTGLAYSNWNSAGMYFFWYGTLTPSTDTVVNEIGIYTKVYDTGGATHEIAVARIVLSSPVTLYANKYNVVLIKWFAL
jgi:hypothetical protein